MVVRDLDLSVAPGEVLAVLGPSGSGKSTLLHAVAGFVVPVAGEICLSGRTVATPHAVIPPEHRGVAMVFQSHALWPHLSVLDTVAYPARRRGVRRRQARAQASEMLARLSLTSLADRRPAELSGGEQQRVGLARALARDVALYLFDEPTSQLDTHLKAAFQAELHERRQAIGAAAVYATHDAAEALALADQVALLDEGRLVQIGSPGQVYTEPVSLWAAKLTGPASMLSVPPVVFGGGVAMVEIGGCTTQVDAGNWPSSTTGALGNGSRLQQLLVRPDWTRVGGPLPGIIQASWFRGPHTDHLLATTAGEVLVREPGQVSHSSGSLMTWDLCRAWPLPV